MVENGVNATMMNGRTTVPFAPTRYPAYKYQPFSKEWTNTLGRMLWDLAHRGFAENQRNELFPEYPFLGDSKASKSSMTCRRSWRSLRCDLYRSCKMRKAAESPWKAGTAARLAEEGWISSCKEIRRMKLWSWSFWEAYLVKGPA